MLTAQVSALTGRARNGGLPAASLAARRGARLRLGGRRAVSRAGGRAAVVTAAALALAGCGLASTGAGPASPASSGPGATAGAGGAGTGAARTASRPLRTSCRSVAHIGDSTSDGLVLRAYQPDARLRIAAQYRRVGVTRFIPEVSGARSIVEVWHGIPNGYTVARRLIRHGYHGCWVLALGTNDTADVAAGSAVGMAARIRRMMSLIGSQPVMWVNVKSLLASGPYSETRMRDWNRALLSACPRYANMRVYDWAAAARRSWFIPDGIHYTPHGYARRARLIASALARAFPAVTPHLPQDVAGKSAATQPGCLVR